MRFVCVFSFKIWHFVTYKLFEFLNILLALLVHFIELVNHVVGFLPVFGVVQLFTLQFLLFLHHFLICFNLFAVIKNVFDFFIHFLYKRIISKVIWCFLTFDSKWCLHFLYWALYVHWRNFFWRFIFYVGSDLPLIYKLLMLQP